MTAADGTFDADVRRAAQRLLDSGRIADGRRILLFSQFTCMLALIETLVAELRIPYCLLTGDTEGRAAVVDRFQSGTVPLFLLSLKAGGAGLNLTAADTVIHYDPWWNPAVEMQATDRAHRIGQDKPVFVYKLIAQGTVEEKILALQADKQALVSRAAACHGFTDGYDPGRGKLSLRTALDQRATRGSEQRGPVAAQDLAGAEP